MTRTRTVTPPCSAVGCAAKRKAAGLACRGCTPWCGRSSAASSRATCDGSGSRCGRTWSWRATRQPARAHRLELAHHALDGGGLAARLGLECVGCYREGWRRCAPVLPARAPPLPRPCAATLGRSRAGIRRRARRGARLVKVRVRSSRSAPNKGNKTGTEERCLQSREANRVTRAAQLRYDPPPRARPRTPVGPRVGQLPPPARALTPPVAESRRQSGVKAAARPGLGLGLEAAARPAAAAAATFGRLRLLVGTHTWRLPLSIELRYTPAEGSRSSARLASVIPPATCPTCATCPTERLARLALALALSGGEVRVRVRVRVRIGVAKARVRVASSLDSGTAARLASRLRRAASSSTLGLAPT
eukprot:scaffold114508_cov56-Phaeocystis_antarctica.AAC.4